MNEPDKQCRHFCVITAWARCAETGTYFQSFPDKTDDIVPGHRND